LCLVADALAQREATRRGKCDACGRGSAGFGEEDQQRVVANLRGCR